MAWGIDFRRTGAKAGEAPMAQRQKIFIAYCYPDKKWLDRIRDHVRQNLSIEREDFELMPVLADAGGWGAIRRAFGEAKLDALIHELNEAIAA